MIGLYRHILKRSRPLQWMSRRKPENEAPQETQQQQYSKQQLSLIKSFEQKSEKANLLDQLLQTDSSKTIKDLIVARRAYQKDKSVEKLKNAILFEQILNNQVQIVLYDTKSRYVRTQFFKYFGIVAVIAATWYCYFHLMNYKEFQIIVQKTYKGSILKFFMILSTVLLLGHGTGRFFKNIKLHVQKIIYNTESQTFHFHRRRFWGSRYVEQVKKYDVAYTDNPHIWAMGANYFNVENRNMYQIAVKEAWLREDLFSHLISQRIRRSMQN